MTDPRGAMDALGAEASLLRAGSGAGGSKDMGRPSGAHPPAGRRQRTDIDSQGEKEVLHDRTQGLHKI